MHDHKTYMYINFQRNQVKTQVMTVHISLFAKNRKLHKFATTKTIFFKLTLSIMYHRKTYMHINFQQNRVSRSVKTVHTKIYLQKIANCINLSLAIRILKITPFEHPLTDIQADFEMNRPTRYQITAKKIWTQTDRGTDERTDRRRVRQQ